MLLCGVYSRKGELWLSGPRSPQSKSCVEKLKGSLNTEEGN